MEKRLPLGDEESLPVRMFMAGIILGSVIGMISAILALREKMIKDASD